MQTGTFRRQVGKTFAAKTTKTAIRTASKNTTRVLVAQGTVALKGHTGQLMQTMSQYLLGLQQTQEMKDAASTVLGDIGFDLAMLCRVLKVKLPASTKKSKLVGTRAAALLQLDGLTTNLLRQVERGVFVSPKMTTVKKMVALPLKGTKEERNVDVVDVEAEAAQEAERQNEMKSYLAGAVDVYWRLCFDVTGKPPAAAFEDKFKRMHSEFPNVTWAEDKPKAKTKAKIAVSA